MSIYRCEECEQMIDGDYFPCVEHPTEAESFCCEGCAEKIEWREKDEIEKMRSENQREVEAGLRRKM